MHAFAYGAMAQAPGGGLRSLESLAARPRAYPRDPFVARQLRHAADQSVRHPDYRRKPHWVWEHNLFALMFTLTGERAAARDTFRTLGGRVSKELRVVTGTNPLRAHRRARHRSGIWW